MFESCRGTSVIAGQKVYLGSRVSLRAICMLLSFTVVPSAWPEILRKIDGPAAADTPAEEIDDGDDAEDEYDPAEPAQANEDGWIPNLSRPPARSRGACTSNDGESWASDPLRQRRMRTCPAGSSVTYSS
jgi:hypothetical protein